MRLILDASAALNIVMRTDLAAGFIVGLERADMVLAPSLFHAEVANALWKYARAGLLDKPTMMTRLDEALGLIDSFEPDERLVAEALSLAVVHEHPVYDLLYVVLAMRFGARLISADSKLIKLAQRIDPGMI